MHKIDPFSSMPIQPVKEITDITNHATKHTAPGSHWYDLDRYVIYRDLFLCIGFVIVIGGFALLSPPVAIILTGLGFIWLAYLMRS